MRASAPRRVILYPLKAYAAMQEGLQSGLVFRFGIFEADAASGELRKHGSRISLQEQPFRILITLLEHAGEVVSREEICRRLWAPGTFVDFEQGLSTAIKKLRQTLGDDAETPRYIETLPKRGYRFIAAVEKPVSRETPLIADASAVMPVSTSEAVSNLAPETSGTKIPVPEDRRVWSSRRHWPISRKWAWFAVGAVVFGALLVLG